MIDLVKREKYKDWKSRGCKSYEDIDKYFEKMKHVYEDIRDKGYRTQKELVSSILNDEIELTINRKGELQKQNGNGHHMDLLWLKF